MMRIMVSDIRWTERWKGRKGGSEGGKDGKKERKGKTRLYSHYMPKGLLGVLLQHYG